MLSVDSSLQVYTTVVSWKYYGVIWSLLVGTGIVFIPIVMALVGRLLDLRESGGSMLSSDSDRALSSIEVMLLRIFIVMLFIAMPATPITLDSNSVRVANNVNDLRVPGTAVAVGTCSNTGTTFDDLESSDGEAICGTNSNVPIWWYGVLRVSHAITQAVVTELTADTNHGFRALTSFLRSGKIQDTSLQILANRFESECYVKAMAAYSNETAGLAEGPGNDDPGYFGRDVSWQGSQFFVDNYYPNLKTNGPVPGMPFDEAANRDVDTSIEVPEAGKVSCAAFWVFLEESVFNEAVSPAAGDKRATWWERNTANIPGNNNREVLVKNYIRNSNPEGSVTTEHIYAAGNRNKGIFRRAGDRVAALPQAAEFIKMSLMATILTDALIKILPIVQAYILMFMVFMLPFGLVVSNYSWGFIVSASTLIFFVTFWSALWAFAAWVDDSMARVLWPDNGDGIWSAAVSFLGAPETWQEVLNKLIHSIVTGATYLLSPVWCSWILASAGIWSASNVGSGVTGGAATATTGGGAFIQGRVNAGYDHLIGSNKKESEGKK